MRRRPWASAHQTHDRLAHRQCRATASGRPRLGISRSPARARPRKRARVAAGPTGAADQGTDLHERLVVPGRIPGALHEPRSQGLQRHWSEVLGHQPREHPLDVAIHGRHGKTERDAPHGARGVAPDARQSEELLPRAGEALGGVPPLLHQAAGRREEMPGPGVVAQPLPQLQHLPLIGFGEPGQGGKALHEPGEVGDDRVHPGLLEHGLRDPDRVGFPAAPPGKIAVAPLEPGQEEVIEALRGDPVSAGHQCTRSGR